MLVKLAPPSTIPLRAMRRLEVIREILLVKHDVNRKYKPQPRSGGDQRLEVTGGSPEGERRCDYPRIVSSQTSDQSLSLV